VSTGIYSIGAVARMLGVPTATLRTWEERYEIVVPERSSGGHRLYTRDQVEQLRFVLRNIDRGLQPADAHRLLADRLTQGSDWTLGDWTLGDPESETRLLIMLAERDPYAAEFAEYFLRTEGYETIVVLDAREAEALFEERSPHLAVVDLLISGGAGPGLCRNLRDRGALVLAISPLESRDEALEYGADAFLQKPLDPLQLVSTVKDLLGDSAFLRNRVPLS
jgi:DNA-binding transcriptional MerR regulator